MTLQKLLAATSLSALLAVAACSSPQEEAADNASEVAEETFESASSSASENIDFGAHAAVAGIFEVESSKLALERSTNTAVKTFAQRMVTDHTKVGTELNAAITAGGTTPTVTALDADHQKMLDDLKAAKPEEFDTKYIDAQQKAHDKTIDLFEDYIKDGPAGPVKDFATKTLPALQAHKADIQKIDDATN